MYKIFTILSDFSFRKNATTHLLRYVYGFLILLAGLGALRGVMLGFQKNAAAGAIMTLLMPVVFVAIVVLVRIGLELVVAVHRIANYMAELVRNQRRPEPEEAMPNYPNEAPRTMGGGGANNQNNGDERTRVSMIGRNIR